MFFELRKEYQLCRKLSKNVEISLVDLQLDIFDFCQNFETNYSIFQKIYWKDPQ